MSAPTFGCEKMDVAVLSSGGKDSTYAVWWAIMKGWNVRFIITLRVTAKDSMMYQLEGTAIAGLQAASGNIPWLPILQQEEDGTDSLERALLPFIAGSSWPRSNTWSRQNQVAAMWPKDWPWPNIKRAVPNQPIQGIVSGALRSDYQRTRIDCMAERLGIHSFSPLWHMPPEEHMWNLIKAGFDVRFSAVAAEGLDESWLGKKLSEEVLEELIHLNRKNGLNIDGEGGEFETSVLSAPWFNSLDWSIENEWNRQSGRIKIRHAKIR